MSKDSRAPRSDAPPPAAGAPGTSIGDGDAESSGASASGNLFDRAAAPRGSEMFETLFENAAVRIERIVSHSHASPEGLWYDQAGHEWVMVARGEALLAFGDGTRRTLGTGDWVFIPARCRHRVETTAPDTVWLAVHVGSEDQRE